MEHQLCEGGGGVDKAGGVESQHFQNQLGEILIDDDAAQLLPVGLLPGIGTVEVCFYIHL